MKLRAALATIAVVLYIASCTSPVGACYYIDHTTDRCRSASFIQLLTPYQRIYKGTYTTVKLPGLLREVFWYCGSSRERTAWNPAANQLRVSYFTDGRIEWVIERC